MKDAFSLTFCGVRGSYPVPGRGSQRAGGNTSCLLLQIAGRAVILDAGTGIIGAGRRLARRMPPPASPPAPIHVFLSHLHSDHIMGLPFFAPMFDPRAEIVLHYPSPAGGRARAALEALFLPPYSPITLRGIKARLRFAPLAAGRGAVSAGGGIEVAFRRHASHPRQGVLIYRVAAAGRRLAYATDVESPDGFDPGTLAFLAGADLLVHDSQYLEADYRGGRAARSWNAGPRRGFGHSTMAMAARNAAAAGAKRLYLFHYDPRYSDADLERMRARARREFPHTYLAREGESIKL